VKRKGLVAGVIQARMGSTRLPKKSLEKIYENYSMFELVLLRTKAAKKLDMIILATSDHKNCDPLEQMAKSLGAYTVRGSETDVLARFVAAIEQFKPTFVVRVCADNPLISPEEIDRLIDYFKSNDLDYATNNTTECGLPDGLGCEIVKAEVLTKISRKTYANYYREHVTSYITSHQDRYSVGRLLAPEHLSFPKAKLDVDTKEDLDKMRAFCADLPKGSAPYWSTFEIIEHAKDIFGSEEIS
jgi:spore coat polysaccharide biosynthesis protein SpsF